MVDRLPRLQPSAYPAAVEAQLATMPHVMFGGLVHEPALTLARRLAGSARRPTSTACFFCDSGSVAVEVAMKMAVQYWLNRGVRGRNRFVVVQGRLSRRHHRRHGGVRSRTECMHGRFARLLPQQSRRSAGDEASEAALERCWRGTPRRSPPLSSSRWCRAPAACAFTTPGSAKFARARRPLRAAVDLRRDLHRLRPHRHDVRLRGGRRRSRHRHAVQGLDRRHAAARRDHRQPKGVRRILVGRSDAMR